MVEKNKTIATSMFPVASDATTACECRYKPDGGYCPAYSCHEPEDEESYEELVQPFNGEYTAEETIEKHEDANISKPEAAVDYDDDDSVASDATTVCEGRDEPDETYYPFPAPTYSVESEDEESYEELVQPFNGEYTAEETIEKHEDADIPKPEAAVDYDDDDSVASDATTVCDGLDERDEAVSEALSPFIISRLVKEEDRVKPDPIPVEQLPDHRPMHQRRYIGLQNRGERGQFQSRKQRQANRTYSLPYTTRMKNY